VEETWDGMLLDAYKFVDQFYVAVVGLAVVG
jgi:hypothetical protein